MLCQLVDGDLPTSRVYEDEHVVAFMDHQPVTPAHVLVVTRVHAALLDDLSEDLGAQMYRVAHRLSRALRRSGLCCEGVNLFLADGKAAFQEIPHLNLHVFPQYDGDTFRIARRASSAKGSRNAANTLASLDDQRDRTTAGQHGNTKDDIRRQWLTAFSRICKAVVGAVGVRSRGVHRLC